LIGQGEFGPAWRPALVRNLIVAAAMALVILPGLVHRLRAVDVAAVWTAIAAVSASAWALAFLATVVSYLAVAGYDRTMHRHLATGIDPARAGRAGASALAIGQTVGLGTLSGALVRWRMLPELGPLGALRLSGAVSLSFLWAWAVLVLTSVWLLPSPVSLPLAPALLAILLLGAALAPVLRLRAAPNWLILGRFLLLAAVDCLAACLALWAVLPEAVGVAQLVPVFLLALGAGLVSAAPGGLGAFELVLLAGLPQVDPAALLGAALGWRLVYLALPATFGALVALRSTGMTAARRDWPLPRMPVPEAALIGQGALYWYPEGFVAGRTPHALVAFGDEVDPRLALQAAQAEGRFAVLYKVHGPTAALARRQGWSVLPVAAEAWLSPQDFCVQGPARSGLRRKLRRAAAAGVVAALDPLPDVRACSAINAAWVAARGPERGFSMGRFHADRLGQHPTVVAAVKGRVVGFATFLPGWVRGRPVWTLDLLRPDPGAPDGTAQALILAALDAARASGVARLSLAAVPMGGLPGESGFIARLERVLFPGAGDGLWQFKAGFAPRWQRVYIAASGPLSLAFGGAEIAHAILRPRPEPRVQPTPNMNCVTGCDAEYEFAPASAAWQGKGKLAN
jgi:phosphatidylglycerol lysyltransferase